MVDIVPNVSDVSFGNDTIRNTVQTVFRYIGNDNDNSITIRKNEKNRNTCQGARRHSAKQQDGRSTHPSTPPQPLEANSTWGVHRSPAGPKKTDAGILRRD